MGQTPLPARTIPTRAAWWGLLGFVVAEIFGILLSGLGYVITGSDTNAVTVLLGEVGLWAGLAGACVFVSRRYGSGSLRRDFSLGFRPVDIGFGVLAAIVGFVLSIFFGALFQHTRFHGSNTQFIAGQKHNSTGFVIAALVASVGAPMFEELFFRGFLRTAFTTRLGATGAIWAQAACFGVAHFEFGTGLGNVSVIVVIGCFGVVLGYTARLTGRLGAGMVAHSLFNAVVTVIILAT